MNNKKKAVVAGHICIDITPVFPQISAENIGAVLSPGKLIHMDGVDIHTGGAVANTGLAMKILGTDVSLMGKVGKDDFGRLILDSLDRYGAGEAMMVSAESDTSYSIVLAVPGIDRIFLHRTGANDTFSCEDIDWERVSQAALFHFGYPPLMKKMYQNQGEELVKMFSRVKRLGTAVSLDMAAVDPASEAGRADWDGILKRVLPYVDFFVPSVEELCFMLDKERFLSWQERAGGREVTDILTLQDVRPLGEKVLEYGARCVVIKCGAPGIYYRTAEGKGMEELCSLLHLSQDAWAGREGFEASYEPEKVLSGTGAGDTSIAAFLTSVLEETSLHEAIQMAAGAGACCVASYDALGGLKSLDEMRKMIENGWKKRDGRTMRCWQI